MATPNVPKVKLKKDGTPAKQAGVPTYTDEQLQTLCDSIVSGDTLAEACEKAKINRTAFLKSIAQNSPTGDARRAMYMRARESQAMGWIDDLIEISNGPGAGLDSKEFVMRDTLKFRTRQWLLSRIVAKVFGDKITQEVTGANGGPIQTVNLVDVPKQETYEEFKKRKERESQCIISAKTQQKPA